MMGAVGLRKIRSVVFEGWGVDEDAGVVARAMERAERRSLRRAWRRGGRGDGGRSAGFGGVSRARAR